MCGSLDSTVCEKVRMDQTESGLWSWCSPTAWETRAGSYWDERAEVGGNDQSREKQGRG